VACAAWLVLVFGGGAFSKDNFRLSLYRGPEREICGPEGYRDGQTCSLEMTTRRFKELLKQGRLTLIKKDIVIPPPDVFFSPQENYVVRHYSSAVAEAGRSSFSSSELASALLVIEWDDRRPRSFGVERNLAGGGVDPPHIYKRPARPFLSGYYHEPLEHLDPQKDNSWVIKANGQPFTLKFYFR